MAGTRARRVILDALRGVLSVAVISAGLALIAGHAPKEGPRPVTVTTTPAEMAALEDTLALLRREEPVIIDPVGTLLSRLSPLSLLAGTFRDGAESLSLTYQRLASTPSIIPTHGWLSSNFTRRRYHPLLGYVRPHWGIDVRAPRGTAIEAPAAGTVVSAGWDGGYGWTVNIDHGFGITTRYAHTSRMLVRQGDRVRRGDVIALVGQTGLAEGPHLHYEVRVEGRPVDPLKFVLPAVIAD